MELSLFTDYALRTLMFAAVSDRPRCQAGQVAEAFSISQNHLVKVVHRLGQLGFLETQRGRGGGFRLARKAEEIRLGEVVRKTEPLGLVECLTEGGGSCAIDGMCGLKHALGDAREAFLSSLDGVTLADILGRREALAAVLRPKSLST